MTGLILVGLAVLLITIGVPLLGLVPGLVAGIVMAVAGLVFIWLELS